ncbi:uncharacterized protein WCC33_012462 [Rhinophrynus dorsalis]
MLVTVYCVRKDLSEVTFSLEVDEDFELENFRALCELESGIPASESLIVYAERPLTDNQRSLSSYGLKDGDVVVLRQKETTEPRPTAPFPGLPRIDFSSIAVPGTSSQPAPPQPRPTPPDSTSFPQGLDNPTLLREMLLANPHELSLLKERNPPLAEALLSGDLDKFTKVLLEQQQERAKREQERIRLFSADPFDLDAQAKIEEDIRQQNIEENMTIAMEEAPESFGQVVMLYINCKVNGYPVKAFVDSGAQMTIMSQACAERCHIMRLVDRRWAGIAKGVGTQKIIGRVHLAQVQIEGDFLPCSFSILEEQPMDMLLGLDMLKRHQCSIDLEKNVLVIGTTGTRTTFLPEGELPECAKLAYGPGREDMRPEEIADRELAEVLQKSAEEADKETTSLKAPSLAPPRDGLQGPAHSSGIASNPCAPSVSAPTTICSHPPTVTNVIEPLPDSSTAESSRTGGMGAVVDGDMDAEQTPAIMHPSFAGSNPATEYLSGVNSEVSQLVSADQKGEALNQPAAVPELVEHYLAPGLTQHLETINEMQESEEAQSPFHVQDPSNETDFVLGRYEPPPSPAGLIGPNMRDTPGEGSISDSTGAVMEVDIPESNHYAFDQTCCKNIDADSHQSTLVPELQENRPPLQDASEQKVTADDTVRFVDIEVSDATEHTSEEISLVPPSTSVQDVDDSCFSLATALKELHKLLVMSGQGPCRVTPDDKPSPAAETIEDCEEPCQNGLSDNRLPKQNAVDVSIMDHSISNEDLIKTESGHRNLGEDLSSPEQVGNAEGCTRSVVGLELSSTNDLRRTKVESCPDSSVAVEPPDTHTNCLVSISSDNYSDITGKSTNPPIVQDEASIGKGSLALNQDCDDKATETSTEPAGLEDEQSESAAGPLFPSPGFSALAVERIVSAGFTLQDAVLALERADGNADLALLALLAKNIVVPT